MKTLALMLASVVVLSACDTPSMEATAADQLIGKQLVSDTGDTFLFNSDGTIGGSLRGEAIAGTYTADAAEICSTYTAPEFLVGREFCSTPAMDGDSIIFNRRDGTQSQSYTIGG